MCSLEVLLCIEMGSYCTGLPSGRGGGGVRPQLHTWRDGSRPCCPFKSEGTTGRDKGGPGAAEGALVSLHVEGQVVGPRELPCAQMTLERLLS
jgi:hypothetical protein